jgi:hypothetical protein
MHDKITAGTFVALAFSAVLGYAAQQPRPGVGAPPVAQPSVVGAQIDRDAKETKAEDLIVTGCVQPGAEPKTYVLAQSPNALVPAGASTSPSVRDRGARYELSAGDNVDLQKLVGRQIEVSGSVVTRIAPAQNAHGAPAKDALPKLKAKSIRETGPTC